MSERDEDDTGRFEMAKAEAIQKRRSAMESIRTTRGTPLPPLAAVARVAHDIAARKGRAIVLLVEDDPDQILLWQRVLHEHADLWIARTVEEARVAIAKGDRFRCVILDHGLPNGDGLQVAVYLRAGDPDVPIHVVTGDANPYLRTRYLSVGGPVTFAEKDGAMAEPVKKLLR